MIAPILHLDLHKSPYVFMKTQFQSYFKFIYLYHQTALQMP